MKKKALEISLGILFAILIPIIYIVYKIMDLYITLTSKKQKPPDYIPFPKTKNTVYPKGWNEECTTEDFNRFYSDISKQLN